MFDSQKALGVRANHNSLFWRFQMENCSLKMERDQIRVEFQGSEAFAVEHLIPVLSKIDWNEKVSDAGATFDRNLSIRTTHAICMRLGHKSGADLFLSRAIPRGRQI
ncbi:MAG: hypothetical protein ACO3NE_14135 [Alphaproteobacteria bacterium]